MDAFKPFIASAASGKPLSRCDAEQAFTMMMSGDATPSQIGGFLMALRVRGETVDELAGAVMTMRAKMLPVVAPDHAMDIVGTGGDASGSYNVSTATAFVVAAAGVPVAKHGNRALSSKSGSADVLKALGVNLDLDAAGISRCIDLAGIGFMFAPSHHLAMKHVGPSRVELGTRTIFNLLGPLSNPAGVKRQLLGVFSPDWLLPIAEDGEIGHLTLTPEEFGIKRATKDQLVGGDAAHNSEALRSVLTGTLCAYRDIVLMNAGAALVIAGKAIDMGSGIALAIQTIESGAALNALNKLVEISNTGGSNG
jgi:anthranilate phosphoribosyltransferase